MTDIGITAESPEQLRWLFDNNKTARITNLAQLSDLAKYPTGLTFLLEYPIILVGCCETTRLDSPADIPQESTQPCRHGYQAIRYKGC